MSAFYVPEMEATLTLARSRQNGSGDARNKQKRKAKKRAAAICYTHGAKPGRRSLAVDIGGEDWYGAAFDKRGIDLEPWSLPDRDMHTLSGKWDGAVAMHVLEHSPCPLYVLRLIRKCAGWLYLSVPHPTKRWAIHEPHFSALTPDGWQRLARDARWRCVHRESGRFGPKSVEERFFFLARYA